MGTIFRVGLFLLSLEVLCPLLSFPTGAVAVTIFSCGASSSIRSLLAVWFSLWPLSQTMSVLRMGIRCDHARWRTCCCCVWRTTKVGEHRSSCGVMGLQMALQHVHFPERLYTDCDSVRMGAQRPLEWACSAKRRLARIWIVVSRGGRQQP